MAIRNPTTLNINTTADINIDIGGGLVNTTHVFNKQSQIGFSSYQTGSLDIDVSISPANLGRITSGVFHCTEALDFQTDEMASPLTTKMFAYDGIATNLTVSSSSVSAATLEFVMGNSL
jgi:hypothetical protein